MYLISNGFSFDDADDWVKKNLIIPLYTQTVHGDARNRIDADNFQHFYGWSNSIIANKIVDFVGGNTVDMTCNTKPEFYAYYADYDWVVFCSLFGRMIDLPNGFPMYCIDLKQMLDEKIRSLPVDGFEQDLERAKLSARYPKQKNEHSAIDDAKWNFELYKYLNSKYKPIKV